MLENHRVRRRLHRLIGDWQEYRDVVAAARGAEITPDDERGFRELEARLAARLRAIQDVDAYAATTEARAEFRAMTDLLKRQRSLQEAAAEEAADPESFGRAWHAHFIFLNQLKGVRLARADARRRSGGRVAAALPGDRDGHRRLRRWTAARRVRQATILIAVVALVWLLVAALGLRYDGGVKRFLVEHQGGAALAVQGAFNAALDAVGGVIGFLSPVLVVYGTVWALVFLLILGLSAIYWVFLRG